MRIHRYFPTFIDSEPEHSDVFNYREMLSVPWIENFTKKNEDVVLRNLLTGKTETVKARDRTFEKFIVSSHGSRYMISAKYDNGDRLVVGTVEEPEKWFLQEVEHV